MTSNRLRIGILGASGYTGGELVRLLACHEKAEIAVVTADRKAGERYDAVFPHLGSVDLPPLVSIDEVDWAGADLDVVFCGLPHGTTQEVVGKLLPPPEELARSGKKPLKVIDISADFRLEDPAAYAKWYGHEHLVPRLQPEAVYGLTEYVRAALRETRLVACPGCYPTTSLLPLLPLVAERLIELDDIIIDAKSGVTGAGRALKQTSLFGEVAEGVNAYGLDGHRHVPEIEQELSKAAGEAISVSFTPHLMPMNRGLLATIYVRLANGSTADDLRAALSRRYAGEPFVMVAPKGRAPATRDVRGSNFALIGVFEDRRPGRAILVSALDNLVKGASGQAVQNMNVMFGLDERSGLQQRPLFP
jgi:N-acetyl-gamma-glutamyl-phosphate reductase